MEPTYADPSASALVAATRWIEALLTGRVATTVAVLAVAWVGLQLLTGRLAWRDGLKVVVGCFIVFGAPAIAQGLIRAVTVSGQTSLQSRAPAPTVPVKPRAPRAPDPYAGASLPG